MTPSESIQRTLDEECPGCKLPPHVEKGLRNFVTLGVVPGGFVRAVLENDLQAAVARADPESFAALKTVVNHVFNCLPGDSWGSREKVKLYSKKMGA